MKATAIVFPELGRAELQEVELPELGPEDLEITSLYTGVSAGTEKNIFTGGNYAFSLGGNRSQPFPLVPGYQQVGTISRVGGRVTNYTVGQRVYAGYWSYPVAVQGATAGGHMSARVGPGTVSALEASRRNGLETLPVELPDSMPDEEAALLSTAAIGLHMAKRVPVRSSDKVLVLGLGLIGQFCAQAARALEGTVTAADRIPERLRLASTLGAHRAVDLSTPDGWDEIMAGGPYDVVLETTGINSLIDNVLGRSRAVGPSLLRPQGSIVLIAGRFRVEYDFNPGQSVEAALMHGRGHTAEDLDELLDYWKKGMVRVAPLITHRFGFDQAPDVYRMIKEGPQGWLGIVFKWR